MVLVSKTLNVQMSGGEQMIVGVRVGEKEHYHLKMTL